MNLAPAMATTAPADDRRLVVAGVALSFIAMTTFLVLPQFIEAVVSDRHFSEREAGVLSSLVMTGSMLAAVAASVWVRRVAWRGAALVALAGMLVANAASVLAGGFAAFATLQAIVGFFGGSLYSLSLTVLSDGRHPDRNFGLSLAAQVSFQVFGLLAGPAIARHGGIDALLWLFAGLCALGLVLVPMLPPHGRRAADAAAGARVLGVPILLALAGCFLFFFNVGCYWTYIELIGSAAGLSLGDLANGLALGVAFGIPGALLASWLGERRGRWLPIALSAAMTVVAATLLSGTLRLPAFVASTVLYNFAWNLSLAYQYSVVNAVDRSGRGVALAPAFHAAGGAAGPAVAALFVNEHDHGGVIWLVSASVLGSLACFSQALRLRTRGFRAVPATIDPRNS